MENAFSKVRKKFCYKKYLNTLQFSFYNIFTWILKIKFWNLFFFQKVLQILAKITLKKANTNEVKILKFYLVST